MNIGMSEGRGLSTTSESTNDENMPPNYRRVANRRQEQQFKDSSGSSAEKMDLSGVSSDTDTEAIRNRHDNTEENPVPTANSNMGAQDEDSDDDHNDEADELNMEDYDSDFVQKESDGEYKVGGYHPVSVGDIFNERYYAIHKLGWGHFSTVWMCFDILLKRYCAIKVVKSAENFAETARDEIEMLLTLSKAKWHPLRSRIINIVDNFRLSGTHGTHLCLVFEVLGDNLLKLIQRSRYKGIPIKNVKQIALQMLEGLYYLHKESRIIHTDLKPENVLLEANDIAARTQATRVVTAFFKANDHLINPKNTTGGMAAAHRSMSFISPDNGGLDPKGTQSSTSNGNNTASKRPFKRSAASSSNVTNNRGSGPNDVPRLSKSAKRKLRARTKRNISFFLEHRQWLRMQAIEDLLVLARYGYLTPILAIEAVIGKLPFMPHNDNIIILNKDDLAQLAQFNRKDIYGRHTYGATIRNMYQIPDLKLEGPQPYSYIGVQLPQGKYSEIMRMLFKSPLEFMYHVQRKTQEWHRLERERHQLDKVTVPGVKRAKISTSSSNIYKKQKAKFRPDSEPNASRSWLPNVDIIEHKDPAKEECQVKVKIADLGNACWIDGHYCEDIQTREYRAPEVILGCGYDEKADIWSAACLIWELATGDYLFNPQEGYGNVSMNEAHLASIIETCGPIPRILISMKTKGKEFFTSKGALRNVRNMRCRFLGDVLVNRYNWSRRDAAHFMSFLQPMLVQNPKFRTSALHALNHPWLTSTSDEEDSEDE